MTATTIAVAATATMTAAAATATTTAVAAAAVTIAIRRRRLLRRSHRRWRNMQPGRRGMQTFWPPVPTTDIAGRAREKGGAREMRGRSNRERSRPSIWPADTRQEEMRARAESSTSAELRVWRGAREEAQTMVDSACMRDGERLRPRGRAMRRMRADGAAG